jgi:hypothetical protein
VTTPGGNTPLQEHVQLIRAAADLIEQAGIAGLMLYPEPGEIVIQVPGHAGDTPARTAQVARLAALTGGEPAPSAQPGRTRGWIQARGTFAGHPVHIFTPVSQEEPAS